MHKIVARFTDGTLVKGTTADFFPNKETFHVSPEGAPDGDAPREISIHDLKGIFFVKDFGGDPQHVDNNEFDQGKPPVGRRIKVVFNDGEVLVGTTTGYQPGRQGFFVVPADAESNLERCFVIAEATSEVNFL